MTQTLLQTQFLKRFIDMEPHPVPVAGPFNSVSVLNTWFDTVSGDPLTLKITKPGVRAFWLGVKAHGAKAVMGKPIGGNNPTNTPPTGGTPAAVAA